MPDRTEYWDIGEKLPFRLGKDACQSLMTALVLCDGVITSTFSLDVHKGEIRYGQKPNQIAVLIRLKLPTGMKEKFEQIMGRECLTSPPAYHLNST